MYRNVIKRVIDWVLSLCAIVVLSPLLAILALCVKFSSPGPVLFCQKRVGKGKTYFQIYKFRSMRTDTPKDMPAHLLENPDAFITPIGHFLRKTSLDELPQLFNLLKGDMSLVGPRPEIPHFVEQFKDEIPLYMVKHQVRPGITGWAQINGLRGDTSIVDRIRYDIYYIENWSIFFDLKILLMTPLKGIINQEKLK